MGNSCPGRAPYGAILDPERPRDPNRVRLDPAQAAVIVPRCAWDTDPQQPVSLYGVAKRLSDAQLPTASGKGHWHVATVRGIWRSPVYAGTAYWGRTRPVAARRRKSALPPVGPGASQQPAPPEEWIAIPVPAIISQETFEAAQARLDRNTQLARRNNTAHEYLLRGLVSCGQCQLSCTGRTLHPGYHYYLCRGRTDALRAAQGERCTARYAPAKALDALVWQDLCRVLTEPALITHELERAQGGTWLPQALQARRKTVSEALAQLERQQERLLHVYLAEIISDEEFERKRKEVTQTHHGLTQQLRQLDAQAQQQVDVMALAHGIEAFCQRLHPTLEQMTFAQRRQLVELLIDCVIVNDGQVEIRYVVPTGPQGETTPFCHLRLDAARYAPAPPRRPRQNGRPRQKGVRLPTRAPVLVKPTTGWKTVTIAPWYRRGERRVQITSATAVWSHSGLPPVPIRWVLVRDPAGKLEPQALLSTQLDCNPVQILTWFVQRWQLETTFEEARAHIGLETPRQWNDRSVSRTTPALLGLYSIITLAAACLIGEQPVPVRATAWYPKKQATFSDTIALVRRSLWRADHFSISHAPTEVVKIPRALFERLTEMLCYAA